MKDHMYVPPEVEASKDPFWPLLATLASYVIVIYVMLRVADSASSFLAGWFSYIGVRVVQRIANLL